MGDAKALAECLDKVLNMSVREREIIGHRAQESVRQNFSVEKMCERTLAVYREFSDE